MNKVSLPFCDGVGNSFERDRKIYLLARTKPSPSSFGYGFGSKVKPPDLPFSQRMGVQYVRCPKAARMPEEDEDHPVPSTHLLLPLLQ